MTGRASMNTHRPRCRSRQNRREMPRSLGYSTGGRCTSRMTRMSYNGSPAATEAPTAVACCGVRPRPGVEPSGEAGSQKRLSARREQPGVSWAVVRVRVVLWSSPGPLWLPCQQGQGTHRDAYTDARTHAG